MDTNKLLKPKKILRDGWAWGKYRSIDFPKSQIFFPHISNGKYPEIENMTMYRSHRGGEKGIYYVMNFRLTKILAVLEVKNEKM